jgi:LytS/YehU family sensor histidine kinase
MALALFTFSIPGTVIPTGERYTPTEIRRIHEQNGEHTGDRNYIYTYSPDGDSNELYLHFDRPLIGRVLMVLLMFSFNIAVKQFVKSMRDKVVMQELERNNLENELQYLKYQINPHFFMNTLNNIHALIDIDAEKAQSTLMELAKLMRYVLYEANSQTILLSKEVQFLTNYVELMRIRYPEGLQVDLDLPENPGTVQVPPLLFVLMVENAFKHGVSYLQPSFISCHMWMEEGTVLFSCTNSKNAAIKENAMGDRHHGIGLDNMQKRLYLLFGDDYRLSINDTAETFNVELSIPVSS